MTTYRKILTTCLLLGVSAISQADIQVKDPALQQCLQAIAKKNSWSNPTQFDEIKCHNKGIRSLQGLKSFTGLRKLSVYKNQIEVLELPQLAQLEHLNIAGNRLTALSIQNFEKLQVLYAFHNKLVEFTVSNCPLLTQVKANNNALLKIELKNVPGLKKLYLFNNELEHMVMPPLEHLRYLDVRQNPMPDEFYDELDRIKNLTSLHDGNAEDWD